MSSPPGPRRRLCVTGDPALLAAPSRNITVPGHQDDQFTNRGWTIRHRQTPPSASSGA
jgi:hypothetical protein